jgi:hypothetical protein
MTGYERDLLVAQQRIAAELKRANDLKSAELKLKYGYEENKK